MRRCCAVLPHALSVSWVHQWLCQPPGLAPACQLLLLLGCAARKELSREKHCVTHTRWCHANALSLSIHAAKALQQSLLKAVLFEAEVGADAAHTCTVCSFPGMCHQLQAHMGMFVPGVGEDGYYSPASEASFSGTSSPDGDKYIETTSNPLSDHYNLVSPAAIASSSGSGSATGTGSRTMLLCYHACSAAAGY